MEIGGKGIFNKNWITNWLIPVLVGVIAYLFAPIILNMFDANTAINRFAIVTIIILLSTLIFVAFSMKGNKKNNNKS